MATTVQGLDNLPPYTVMLWNQFESNPTLMYNLFQSTVRPGGRTYHSDVAMDMSSAKFSYALRYWLIESTSIVYCGDWEIN